MTAAYERYLPTVDALKPCLVGDERRARAGLMLTRDIATNGSRRATDEAAQILHCIAGLSASACLADLAPWQLEDIHRTMVKMLTCARDVQRITQGE